MNRADWFFGAVIFTVVFLEALLLLTCLTAQLLPDSLVLRSMFVEWLLTSVSAGCALCVAVKVARQQRRAREIESLATQRERLAVQPEGPRMTALDYCLLLPIFGIAFAFVRVVVFSLALGQVLGVGVETVPYHAQSAIATVLAACLTVSDAWSRITRRHRRTVDRRAKLLARRAAALAHGHCPACDYDLTGLPERRCPECGEPWTAAEADEAKGER